MKRQKRQVREGTEPKVNIEVSVQPFGNFVFKQTLGRTEKRRKEKSISVPYVFPGPTSPACKIIWSPTG